MNKCVEQQINLSLSLSKSNNFFKKIQKLALASVAQWIGCWPANQRVAGLIPSQGTCLGFRSGPQ